MKIKIQCMRSGTTVLAALVALAAAAASACGVAPGSARARAGLDAAGLPAGQLGTRAQVPWRSVGPGWALAEYSASTVRGARHAAGGPAMLYLIDPGGGRYARYRWPYLGARQPLPQLVDWSGDKARALLIQPEQSSPWQLVQITLATGRVSAVRLPPNETVIGYTKPDGLNILATRGSQQDEIVRLNLTGHLQAVLIRGKNLSGVASPDGTTLAVSGTGGRGLYVQALGPCGTVFIARQAADGSVRAISIPGAEGNNNKIITGHGSRLLIQAQTGCPGSNSLLWFNPRTSAVQMVLKAPSDAIGAFDEVPYAR